MKPNTLFVLYFQGDTVWLYQRQTQGLFAAQETPLTQAEELRPWVENHPQAMWVVLVDQIAETFWNEHMPFLWGSAHRAWIKRLLENSSLASPFMAYQVQGRLPQDRSQRKVLCLALGEHLKITPWLDFLLQLHVRIRGLYTPALLAPMALRYLQMPIEGTTVLITPHPEGMRECVVHENRLAFSRIAFHTDHQDADGSASTQTPTTHRSALPSQSVQRVLNQVAYLRSRLVQEGILATETSPMRVVLAGLADVSSQMQDTLTLHARQSTSDAGITQFTVVAPEDPRLFVMATSRLTDSTHEVCGLFLNLLTLWQPHLQLASDEYRSWDRRAHAVGALQKAQRVAYLLIGLLALWAGAQIWHAYSEEQSFKTRLSQVRLQYAQVARQFASLPMTSSDMDQVIRYTHSLAEKPHLEVHALLSVWGQTLLNHPSIRLESVEWKESSSQEALQTDRSSPWLNGLPSNKPLLHLHIKGQVQWKDSLDLHKGRDMFLHFVQDIRTALGEKGLIHIDQTPFDLSAGQSIMGKVGELQSTNVHFQLSAWQY
jgi:hypothetical protein